MNNNALKAKKLYDIIPSIENVEIFIHGTDTLDISGLSIDSRNVTKGFVYAALRGTLVDGHDFIDQAIVNGAACIVCEVCTEKIENVTYIVTSDVRRMVGEMAHLYFERPSEHMKLVGVTGTNGKTTVSTLLYQLFTSFGYKCGLISTVENRIGDQVILATHTTPDVISVHSLVARMKSESCDYVFMEVSSHAVDQQRISGLKFTGALFTNITHDHLDYHKTMKNYITAKKKFFDLLPKEAFAITNLDDKNGLVMLQNTKAKKSTYSLRSMSDYKVKVIESSIHGLVLKINDYEAHFRLIGEFNAYNLGLVYAAADCLGMQRDEILAVLSGLKGAEGRFEQVIDESRGICGIVDYAHTPDALENVLETILKVKLSNAKVITVVGCGGDRDAAKRPLMAKVAAKFSDTVVITSDNPRSEDPEVILDQMENGLDTIEKKKMLRISDRWQAIKTAIMLANDNDIILIAGKGHENYQEIQGKKFPFDDKKILKDLLG